MKAIAIQKFGGPEVLESMDLPKPSLQSHEVLVKIRAAGVNPVDVKIRKGLFQGRMPYEFPIVLGWDCSGVVEEVGADIKEFKKGDEVMAYARKERVHDGTYAEFIALEPSHLCLKPKNFSFEEAAVIPLSGLTAYQSLFESLALKKGETILIHAGAGGVGGYAIQLAKNAGVRVMTTASESNHDYVRRLGADEVIDYFRQDFVGVLKKNYPEGIDAVFDTVGGEVQKRSAEVLKKSGRLTSILALDEECFRSRGLRASYVFVRPDSVQLNRLREMVEQSLLKVHLAHTFSLGEVSLAHQIVESGRGRGKIALKV